MSVFMGYRSNYCDVTNKRRFNVDASNHVHCFAVSGSYNMLKISIYVRDTRWLRDANPNKNLADSVLNADPEMVVFIL